MPLQYFDEGSVYFVTSWHTSLILIITTIDSDIYVYFQHIKFLFILKQESPPAWTQEAYLPPRSKYTLCCFGRGGVRAGRGTPPCPGPGRGGGVGHPHPGPSVGGRGQGRGGPPNPGPSVWGGARHPPIQVQVWGDGAGCPPIQVQFWGWGGWVPPCPGPGGGGAGWGTPYPGPSGGAPNPGPGVGGWGRAPPLSRRGVGHPPPHVQVQCSGGRGKAPRVPLWDVNRQKNWKYNLLSYYVRGR